MLCWRISLNAQLILNKLSPPLLQDGSVSALTTIWTHLLHVRILLDTGHLHLLLVQALGVQGPFLYCLLHLRCLGWSWNNEEAQRV